MDIREVKKIYDRDKERGIIKQISHYAKMYGGDFYNYCEGKFLRGEIDFDEYLAIKDDIKSLMR